MKKLSNILAFAAAAFAMTACTTDLDEVRIDPTNVVPPTVSVPATVDLGSQAATVEFDYTPIDYGFQAAVKYTLHIELTDSQKELSLDAAASNGKFAIDRFAMNNALIGAGAAPAAASAARMWVEAGMVNSKNVVIASTICESEKTDTKFVPYVWSVKGVLSADGTETVVDMKETAADTWLAEKVTVCGAFKFVYNHKDAGAMGGTFTELKKDFSVSTAGAAIEIAESDDFKAGDMVNIRLNTATNVASVSIPDICWSLIGVNGDWNKDIDMIEVLDGVWMSPVTEMEGNFKLRFAAGWDINRGGAIAELGRLFAGVPGGDNIALPKKAKYQVLYYEALDKIIVKEARAEDGWSVIGGTVMNDTGWTADFYMQEAADGKWFIDNLFVDGSCKIRFACDWGTNRGGKFADLDTAFEVKPDGDNINLYKNWYNIVYDPAAETITVSAGESYVEGGREYPTEIGLTGAFSGYNWNMADAPKYAMDKYSGATGTNYVLMTGDDVQFKVTHGENNWVGGTLESNADGVYTFSLGSGDNMKLPAGIYAFVVNLAEEKAVFTKLERVGIIGAATPNGWGGETWMTLDAADNLYKWSGTLSADIMKVRFDGDKHEWAYNLGGEMTDLVHNGGDMPVAEGGDYEVVLDLVHTPNTLTLTKK